VETGALEAFRLDQRYDAGVAPLPDEIRRLAIRLRSLALFLPTA